VRGCRSVTTLLITAPWLLSLLGGSYSDEGSTVLRLMAAAVPFLIITNLYVSTSRIRQQMGRVVTIQLLTAVAVIALRCPWSYRWGSTGLAWPTSSRRPPPLRS